MSNIIRHPALDLDASVPPLIHCLSFKRVNTGSLIGFADIHIPRLRVKIFGCPVHARDGRRWATLPAKVQVGPDGNSVMRDESTGKVKYLQVLAWDTDSIKNAFSSAVCEAVAAYDATAFSLLEGER